MNKFWLFGAALGIVFAFGSCKPKQSAYRTAYEQAKEKESTAPVAVVVDQGETIDIAPVSRPRTTTTPPADAPTRAERINAIQGENPSHLKRYSVVIGSFRNQTNAHSLKERMQRDGYNPVLGENEQGMLRVIVSSFDDKTEALRSRDAVRSRYSPNFRDAWILERQY